LPESPEHWDYRHVPPYLPCQSFKEEKERFLEAYTVLQVVASFLLNKNLQDWEGGGVKNPKILIFFVKSIC
jgi:hypothetical protein